MLTTDQITACANAAGLTEAALTKQFARFAKEDALADLDAQIDAAQDERTKATKDIDAQILTLEQKKAEVLAAKP